MLSIRRILWKQLLVALFLSLALSAPAHAKPTAQQVAARKAIAAQYAAIDAAFAKKDINAVGAIDAPDYQFFSVARIPQTREQHLGLQLAVFNTTTRMSSRSRIKSVEWRGPDAIVWVEITLDWDQLGKSNLAISTTRDYWGLINGKWMIRQSAENKAHGHYGDQPFAFG